MPRVRIGFGKGAGVRFVSHLDLMKAFERAIRRAEIPIAFSEGFNPHPKMSFASALAVGVTSETEYMDMDLRENLGPEEVARRLAAALPPGIEIKSARLVPQDSPPLMARVNRARYDVRARPLSPLAQEALQAYISKTLDLKELVIEKNTKKGPKPKDIRPGIIELTGRVAGEEIIFDMLLLTGNEGNIRPEEVIQGLRKAAGLPVEPDSVRIHRTGLYIMQGAGPAVPV
ncbi:MAG: TIGR03936 family radical SAM-associated protein [Bacillota bacterium]